MRTPRIAAAVAVLGLLALTTAAAPSVQADTTGIACSPEGYAAKDRTVHYTYCETWGTEAGWFEYLLVDNDRSSGVLVDTDMYLLIDGKKYNFPIAYNWYLYPGSNRIDPYNLTQENPVYNKCTPKHRYQAYSRVRLHASGYWGAWSSGGAFTCGG